MGLFLNLTLISTAFVYAATAFGGETWIKGDLPLVQRITRRGWICLALLVLTLTFGTTKEINGHLGEGLLRQERDDAKKQLRDVQDNAAAANDGIKTARGDLAKTETSLSEAQARLQDAQGRLQDTQGRVVGLQTQAQEAQRRLQDTQGRLQDAHGRLVTLQSQTQELNQELLTANKSLTENREVVNGIAKLAGQINKVGVMSALSRSQERLVVKVAIQLKPQNLTGTPAPYQVVETLFPNWQQIAVPKADDPERDELMISLTVESEHRHLIGSVWGFRNDPYAKSSVGQAQMRPTGAESSLSMFSDAGLLRVDKDLFLEANYLFPTPQVAGAWLSELLPNTKIFEASFHLNHNLTESQVTSMKRFWDELFEGGGTIRIELLDQESFFLEYDIQKRDAVLKDDWFKVTYTIASKPRLITENL